MLGGRGLIMGDSYLPSGLSFINGPVFVPLQPSISDLSLIFGVYFFFNVFYSLTTGFSCTFFNFSLGDFSPSTSGDLCFLRFTILIFFFFGYSWTES